MLRQFSRAFSTSGRPTIGFIGLGQMGSRMANNLLKAGHNLVVFDKFPQATQQLVDAGAQVADTPRQVAEQASTLVTMLPSSPHVRECYTGPDGIFNGIQDNALLIDSSTIDPGTSQEMAQQATTKGARMIDAPVSGGVGGAAAGTLTFMVGGPQDDFRDAHPILSHMGTNIVHCGDVGTGQVAKVCNNLILGISMVGVSEAMALGTRHGMDPKILAGIVNTSSGRCWSSDTYNPVPGVLEGVPSSNNYEGGFGSDLMKKDLSLALMAAESSHTYLPLATHTHQVYEDVHQDGNGDKDFSFVYEHIMKRSEK